MIVVFDYLSGVVIGQAKIFLSTRKLLSQGYLIRLVAGSGGTIDKKTHYIHLFNDALIFSQRNSAGMFKLCKAVDLSTATVTNIPIPAIGARNSITIDYEVPGNSSTTKKKRREVFVCPTAEDTVQWYNEIQRVIETSKSQVVDSRVSKIQTIPLSLGEEQTLGLRARKVFDFLGAELRWVDAMSTLAIAGQ